MKSLAKHIGQLTAVASIIGAAAAPMAASAQSVMVYDSQSAVLYGGATTPGGEYYGQCLGSGCGPHDETIWGPFEPATMLGIGDKIRFSGEETVLTGFNFGILFGNGFSGSVDLSGRLDFFSAADPLHSLFSVSLGAVKATIPSAVQSPIGQPVVFQTAFPTGVDVGTYLGANNREIIYTLTLTPNAGSKTSGFGVLMTPEELYPEDAVGDVDQNSWWQITTGNPVSSSNSSILSPNMIDITGFPSTPAVQFMAAAVPEPSTYGMMALGLVAVGMAAKRRSRTK